VQNAALQPGTTPGLCPYGHTQCVPAVDATESAQRIRQLKQELADTKKQLSKRDQRFEEKLREKDERIREQDERLAAQDEKILELIKRVPEQTTSPAKTHKKTKRKKKKKAAAKKTTVETAFKPWGDPGDACFVLDGPRVKIWNGEDLTDLKLRGGSKADKLLPILSAGALTKKEIKKTICTPKTSPYDAVRDVNRLLNGKIKTLNIKNVPPNTAFIACDERTGHYCSTLPIKSFQEFEYG
jgi:flagellar biosynthesis GTPase FlhF